MRPEPRAVSAEPDRGQRRRILIRSVLGKTDNWVWFAYVLPRLSASGLASDEAPSMSCESTPRAYGLAWVAHFEA